ncbi:MAG: UMP kinase [Methanosphaera sp.]|uniref:UMP kinase n=1 Tax=Methanosphaera sp. TaxID=2666342 RepID=UPI0025EFC2FC|nr:UMP kinase [Methanosphaera sp.]MCI5867477.1 UMP kinase [Methanosphaera sp.]MDD6534455.1 UMP kinase [Methanosphaera sp.]MDY3955876.1 UMP kinase [Methanosphaera sp.]
MRIVITIGGSILLKEYDSKRFEEYAEVIRQLNQEHEIFIVVGGGKPARQYISVVRDMGETESICDEIGIQVTRINARLLQCALKDIAYPAIPTNFQQALEYSATNKIVIMGGTEPAHSTDAVGSILAEYVGADLVINATSVDGLYDKDPNKFDDAKMFTEVTADQLMEVVSDNDTKAGTYEFIDKTAIEIIKRSSIKTIILNGNNPENLITALNEPIGTVIKN